MNDDLSKISNSDVAWTGNYLGLTPTLSGHCATVMERADTSVIPELTRILQDPARFVAAHVLLTKLSGIRYQVFPQWNGLNVDIDSDGSLHYDSEQRFELADRWRSWIAGRDLLNELPPW
jgi:hypothetical protein